RRASLGEDPRGNPQAARARRPVADPRGGGRRHGPAGARAPAGRADGGSAQRGLRETMAIINYAQKVINFKVVYYGPGVAGKTANLQHIHKSLPNASKGNMISPAAGDDPTPFFDFLPVSPPPMTGFPA